MPRDTVPMGALNSRELIGSISQGVFTSIADVSRSG